MEFDTKEILVDAAAGAAIGTGAFKAVDSLNFNLIDSPKDALASIARQKEIVAVDLVNMHAEFQAIRPTLHSPTPTAAEIAELRNAAAESVASSNHGRFNLSAMDSFLNDKPLKWSDISASSVDKVASITGLERERVLQHLEKSGVHEIGKIGEARNYLSARKIQTSVGLVSLATGAIGAHFIQDKLKK